MMQDDGEDFRSPTSAPGDQDNTPTPAASPGAKARRDKEVAAQFLNLYRAPTGDVLPSFRAFGEQGLPPEPPHVGQPAMARPPTGPADVAGPPPIGLMSTPPAQLGASGAMAPQMPAPPVFPSQPALLPAQPSAPLPALTPPLALMPPQQLPQPPGAGVAGDVAAQQQQQQRLAEAQRQRQE